MDELIAQTRDASGAGLYYVALLSALAIPDICGALASSNGRATGSKYRSWLQANVPEEAHHASAIWNLRCSLLHQGSATKDGSADQVAFVAPQDDRFRVHGGSHETAAGVVTYLDSAIFVTEVTSGAENWWASYGDTKTVQRNFARFARLRPAGLDEIGVTGLPVFA